jgi:hypothetical protein
MSFADIVSRRLVYPTNDSADSSKPQPHSGRTFDNYPEHRGTYDSNFGTNPKAIEASPIAIDHPSTPTRRYAASGQQRAPNRQSWAPDTLNVRVLLEHSSPRSPSTRRYSSSPLSYQEPMRTNSVRRKRSRSGLKEYSAKQAMHELARELRNESDEPVRRSRTNGNTTNNEREHEVNGVT